MLTKTALFPLLVASALAGCAGLDPSTPSTDDDGDAAGKADLPSATCDTADATPVGDCELFLGWSWDGHACQPLSGCDCVGADCAAATEQLADCELAHADCGGEDDSSCRPQDATGFGDCDLALGWAWDGVGCALVVGCECIGLDCADLAFDGADCEAAHAEC